MALNLTSSANARMSWQFNYRLALLYEALEELPEARTAINRAFHHVYFNEILVVKQRIEAALKAGDAEPGRRGQGGEDMAWASEFRV